MKTLKNFLIAMVAVCLASCGGNVSIKPVTKKINGPLGKFFEIVDREYKVKDGEVNIEFIRISEGGPKDASWSTHPTFTAELHDEDGNVIDSESTDVVFTEDQLEAVFSLGVDESSSIKFSFGDSKGAVKFKVSSKWDVSEDSDDSSTSSTYSYSADSSDDTEVEEEIAEEISSSSSDSEDWDELLNSYEQYVDKYISYVKKAANGDLSALTEYPALMEKAQEFSEKMANAQDDMSASQWAKYMKITNKMLKAAQDM